MKIRIYLLAIMISAVFVSCPFNGTSHQYFKSFYLGETTFTFEGAVYTDDRLDTYSPKLIPFSFDSVIVKIGSNSSIYNDWEIFGTKTAENQFQMLIDIVLPKPNLPFLACAYKVGSELAANDCQ